MFDGREETIREDELIGQPYKDDGIVLCFTELRAGKLYERFLRGDARPNSAATYSTILLELGTIFERDSFGRCISETP